MTVLGGAGTGVCLSALEADAPAGKIALAE